MEFEPERGGANLKGSTIKQLGWNSRQKGWFFNLHSILKRENRLDVSGFYVCRNELGFFLILMVKISYLFLFLKVGRLCGAVVVF